MTTNDGLSWWERVRFFIRARQCLRAGAWRIRSGWVQILQTAVAALVLGQEQPVFAPIAAVLSLGASDGETADHASPETG